MTTQEHLMKIKAKCQELLAVAEKHNAAFIAPDATPAEAGWRATITAIDGLLALSIVPNVEAPDDMHTAWEQVADEAKEHLSKLIAAWPEELLS